MQVRIQQARTEGASYTQLARRFPQFSRSALYRHTHGKHRQRPIAYAAFQVATLSPMVTLRPSNTWKDKK